MNFASTKEWSRCARPGWRRSLTMALLLFLLPGCGLALPTRLVLALDGVAYRDLAALQTGILRTNFWGQTACLRAFTAAEGYFPVSRMISTFPSTSDVAWTDIFGDRPLPGYQRTYYSSAANSLIELNGVTSTMEHERQMDWQVQNGFIRAMGYMYPAHTFTYEIEGMTSAFWQDPRSNAVFYAYVRASDDAQHLDRDIFALLVQLDRQLQKMRAQYHERTGRDLEIVILSDHGHNHAGRGIRVRDKAFLQHAGYHVTTSINGPQDVVLPVVGVESWVEVHCAAAATEKLAQKLCELAGVDVLAATIPAETNRFLIMNSRGERADLGWNPARNSFCYRPLSGDPIQYAPLVALLAHRHQLDAAGYAPAEAWLAVSRSHHYPLAPERIVRGLTRNTLNPANILVSLDNRYVNDSWLVQQGSRLVTCRSTHGGLDDLCSDGMLLSNFAATSDTSTARVAAQFGDFADVKDYHAVETGAELVDPAAQALTRISREPFDLACQKLSGDEVYLHLWSPLLATLDLRSPISAAIRKVPHYATSPGSLQIKFDQPLIPAATGAYARLYTLPTDLKLEPLCEYCLSACIPGAGWIFSVSFHTTETGRPAAF
jgi:hypothetical protein